MKLRGEFRAADFAVFLCSVGVCLVIGIVFAVRERKRNTTVNYFLANRNYRILPLALSYVVTFQSSLLLLGFPAEAYAYGIGIAYCAIGVIMAYTFTAIFIVPVLHPLKLTSVYGYFKLRFGNNVLRYITVAIGITYSLLYMAIIIVGTCVVIETVLEIPFWATILIYSVLTSIYTSLGGMKAVIWTDVFQLIVMVCGIFTVLIKSSLDAGGPKKVFQYSHDRLRADFRVDPTIRFQFWNVSFGSFSTLLTVTLTQQAMQRVFSTPTVKSARYMYFICSPIYALFVVLVTFQGATIFAYFVENGCDIVEAGLVSNVNAIIPVAILELFRHQPGLAGLFTASLSSAALSTLSSCLSGLSAITFEDMIKVKYPDIHADKATNISKCLVILYGLLTVVFAFAIANIPGSIASTASRLMSCVDGPMCSIFLLSIMYRGSTTKGLVTGTLCGMAVSVWLNIGSKFSGVPHYQHLPPGPTDQCYMYTDTSSLYRNISSTVNSTVFVAENLTYSLAYNTATALVSVTSHPKNEGSPDLTTLQRIYSISYVLFSMIGLITSLLVGFVVSLFTNPPESYDKRCLFSFRKHVIEELWTNKESVAAKHDAEVDDQDMQTFL